MAAQPTMAGGRSTATAAAGSMGIVAAGSTVREAPTVDASASTEAAAFMAAEASTVVVASAGKY
ncbi:hypothetical protein ASF56_24660 [Methylobacterium sp. Leaf122]|nr:hypothetical protein ASF59_01875 [Methylobacterium sp. Leaf121]KQQ11683.1 hypothetical protein ASF56_24660 [Methylobacterium sp. Leaf122]